MGTFYAGAGDIVSGTQQSSDVLSIPNNEKLGNCIAYVVHDSNTHMAALGHLDTSTAMASLAAMTNLMQTFKTDVEAELTRIGGTMNSGTVVVGASWRPPQLLDTEWGYVRDAIEAVFPNATHHAKAMKRFAVAVWEDRIVINKEDDEDDGNDLDWN